jgi:hypothetical protein
VRLLTLEQVDSTLGRFDTVLMLGNNFGLVGSRRSAKRLLKRLRQVVTAHGKILAQTLDPYQSHNPDHLAYHAHNRSKGRMSGQIRMRLRYKTFKTPWFDYLFVSRDELESVVQGTGWEIVDIITGDGPDYVAELRALRSLAVSELSGVNNVSWSRDLNIHREELELVLVYIGSASCGPCNDPEYNALLSQFKRTVSELAHAERRKLRLIGVSDDWDVDAGLQFLRERGPWDEVVAGNNIYNSAVIEHVWNVESSHTGIPQVILFERRITYDGNRLVTGPKQYLLRLVGKAALAKWLADANYDPEQPTGLAE